MNLVCTECGARAEGNCSWSDGSGEICDACIAQDKAFAANVGNAHLAHRNEYTVHIGGRKAFTQLCQTPKRGNEIMVQDLRRFDPFQRHGNYF